MSPAYRLAVMADIHGNLPAFEAVMADLQQYPPLDGYLVAGDIVGGPGQEGILQALMALIIVVAHGNGEVSALQVADGHAHDYVYTAQQFLYSVGWLSISASNPWPSCTASPNKVW